ncbi:unnamed protein product [Ostreobium quekettii]|uniref:C-type lectin domain-containing protein n=1 Tax=Ostreobium quekettii TaxID=121088 RepID=A0A8S1JB08_9CHLO|nr:unnamed protein product [Ostreobium quekettii]|eukprot:evm.model.scf_101EXC.8 EVM.evm.TU.scf_101EXC.8   scf_101EXC:133378-142249(-)
MQRAVPRGPSAPRRPLLLLLACLSIAQGIDEGVGRAACDDVPADLVEAANLTIEEEAMLEKVCWREELAREWRERGGLGAIPARDGIPAGVVCKKTLWCDRYKKTGICSEVCKPGTVRLDEWLVNAIRTQVELASQLPFCYSQFSGTHNSAITLANGYGNRDLHFQQYFKFMKHMDADAKFETNDQWFSLTDQLNMGVRLVELDVHYVEHKLRIAHCGGIHSKPLDDLVKVLNVVAKLLGDHVFWDSETVGCQPSMSSIGVHDERLFRDALQEIALWMNRTENQDQFVTILLDAQMDIQQWGKLHLLMNTILEVFPKELIFTPPDVEAFFESGPLPSFAQMLALGRRILFIVDEEWSRDSWKLIFSNRHMCDWTEPSLGALLVSPSCSCIVEQPGQPCDPTMYGQVMRVETCELTYGVFDCGLHASDSDGPILDNVTLPRAYDCGINFPSPDLLTPQRAAATIWSWAPGQPQKNSTANGPMCVYISASDGRWRSQPCQAGLPTACRQVGHRPRWRWALEESNDGGCPTGFVARAPRHALENSALQRMLQGAGLAVARLELELPTPGREPMRKWGSPVVVEV